MLTINNHSDAQVFLDHMVRIVDTVPDSSYFMAFNNMTCRRDSLMYAVGHDPVLRALLGARMAGHDFLIDGSFITDPGEVMNPEYLSHFIFDDETYPEEEAACGTCGRGISGKQVFMLRLATLRHAINATADLEMDTEDWANYMTDNLDQIGILLRSMSRTGGLRFTFDTEPLC